jgi:hypothetical protein
MSARLLSLCLALSLAACGDPLVDENYRGKALASLETNAVMSEKSFKHPRAAFFWSNTRAGQTVDTLVEQVSTSQAVEIGKPLYMRLFETPDTLLDWSNEGSSEHRVALGRLLIYDDTNNDGRYDESEQIRGGLYPYGLVYAPEDVPAGGIGRIALARGLHTGWLPFPCSEKPPPRLPPACTNAPLGIACKDPPADCGQGTCTDRFMFPWPQGACLVKDSVCLPEDGVVLHQGRDSSFFVKACSKDADCDRTSPYRCDPLQGACVPYNLPLVDLDNDNPFPPFCAGGMPPPGPDGGTQM